MTDYDATPSHFRLRDVPDRDAWLEDRRSGIGASDIAGIVGESPYATPFSVWAEKVHGTGPRETAAMEWGRRLEDVILDAFQTETGLEVPRHWRQVYVEHPDHPWARATLDGLAYSRNADGFGDLLALGLPLGWPACSPVEAKTSGGSRWPLVPVHIAIQMQWQLYVTGLSVGWVAVLHSGRTLEVHEVRADPAAQEILYDRAAAFWENHVLAEIPPDVEDGQAPTVAALSAVWPTDDGTAVELSEETAAKVEALRGLKIEAAALKKWMDALQSAIKAELKDAAVGTRDGEPIVTWRTIERKEVVIPAGSHRRLHLPRKATLADE